MVTRENLIPFYKSIPVYCCSKCGRTCKNNYFKRYLRRFERVMERFERSKDPRTSLREQLREAFGTLNDD